MCRLKSVLILKDKVFCPDYDSHDEMLAELGIADTRENAERLFVRAEITPDDIAIYSPVSAWKYCVDQDIIPDWYVAEVDEERARKAVEEWAKVHVLTEGHRELKSGFYLAYDNSTVKAYGNSTVKAYGNSTVKAYDNSTVEACGNSTVKAYDNSTVVIPSWSSNSGKKIIAPVLINHRDGIIKAWGKEIKR